MVEEVKEETEHVVAVGVREVELGVQMETDLAGELSTRKGDKSTQLL